MCKCSRKWAMCDDYPASPAALWNESACGGLSQDKKWSDYTKVIFYFSLIQNTNEQTFPLVLQNITLNSNYSRSI